MAASGTHRGWWRDIANARLVVIFNGTQVVRYTATAITHLVATSITGGITAATSNIVATLGDIRASAGNFRAGTVSTFGTTEPTAWIVFKSATQPAGAIATSGGVGANDTTVQKIVAAGTIDNVQT